MPPSWLTELHDLLAQPDPPDLIRGHRVTCPGEPNRRVTRFLPLLTAWAQHRYVRLDPPAHIGKAKKGPKGFRLIIADRRRIG